MEDVNDFTVSFDGEKILYRKGDAWATASHRRGPAGRQAPPKPGFGPLKLDGWEVYVEPRAMWKQIYNETWRIERDFFYDPHYHGLDLEKAKKKYAPYLDGIASRDELTYLFQECLGEMTVGHMFVGGGETPEPKKVKGGLLGADYSLENGRYRIAKVYNGENWNPGIEAPLTQPGVNVKAGDYLLAVNGRDLHASDNIYSFFEETAGKQVVLKVGANPDGKDSRDVTVVPVESEENLRHLAWIESNRRRVDQATGGRIAYVHVPNTAGGGYTSFNRYYFSQVGKEGAIIDERFNEGGQLADYIIDYPLCTGNYMASNPRWRQPLQSWLNYFHEWMTGAELHGTEDALIFFDMRPVAGDFSLYEAIAFRNRELLKDAGMFKSVLAFVSTTRKPPLGFFRSFVLERSGEHKNQLDLKLFGTGPIVDATRVLALDAGIEHTNTLDRLSALSSGPKQDPTIFQEMQEAFEFLTLLRLECQLRQVRDGHAQHHISPDSLTHLQRSLLKEAFRASARAQALIEERFRTAIWSQLGR